MTDIRPEAFEIYDTVKEFLKKHPSLRAAYTEYKESWDELNPKSEMLLPVSGEFVVSIQRENAAYRYLVSLEKGNEDSGSSARLIPYRKFVRDKGAVESGARGESVQDSKSAGDGAT